MNERERAVLSAASEFVDAEMHGFARVFSTDPLWLKLRDAVKILERQRMSEQDRELLGDPKDCPTLNVIRNVPLERVVEDAEPREVFPTLLETAVPVSQLLTGDSVFSESAGTWHDVRVDGQALFLKRGESWVNMSHLPRDTVFRTRRGVSGRAAGVLFDNFGGEVIRDARD